MRTLIRIRRRIKKAQLARSSKFDFWEPVRVEWYKNHDGDFEEACNMCPDMFWDEEPDVDAWMEPV